MSSSSKGRMERRSVTLITPSTFSWSRIGMLKTIGAEMNDLEWVESRDRLTLGSVWTSFTRTGFPSLATHPAIPSPTFSRTLPTTSASSPRAATIRISPFFSSSSIRETLSTPRRSEEHTSELQSRLHLLFPLFFFNDAATTEIYPLPLHDALPIFQPARGDDPDFPLFLVQQHQGNPFHAEFLGDQADEEVEKFRQVADPPHGEARPDEGVLAPQCGGELPVAKIQVTVELAVSQKERPFFHADPDGPPYVVGVLEGSVEKIVDVLMDPPAFRFPGGAIGQDHDLGIRGDPPDPARQRVTVPSGHRPIHQGDGKRLAGQQIEPLLDRPRRMGIAPFAPEELREFFEVGRPLPDEQDFLSVHPYSSPPGGNSPSPSPPVSPTVASLCIGRKTEFIYPGPGPNPSR